MGKRPADFDPYCDWLGIPPDEQPPDHYRLLGIARFENNPEAIHKAADEKMAHVRRFQTGPRGHYTQDLLNNLSAAKLTLLDEGTRNAYESAIREQQAASVPATPLAGQPLGPMPGSPIAASPVSTDPVAVPTSTVPRAIIPDGQVVGPSVSPMPRAVDQTEQPDAPLYLRTWFLMTAVALVALACGLAIGINAMFVNRRTDQPRLLEHVGMKDRRQPVIEEREGTQSAETDQLPVVVNSNPDGSVNLTASMAVLRGDLQLVTHDGQDVIANWKSAESSATWQFKVIEGDFYLVETTYALTDDARDNRFSVQIGEATKANTVSLRDGPGVFITDELTLPILRAGVHTLTVQTSTPTPKGLMYLKNIHLSRLKRGKK